MNWNSFKYLHNILFLGFIRSVQVCWRVKFQVRLLVNKKNKRLKKKYRLKYSFYFIKYVENNHIVLKYVSSSNAILHIKKNNRHLFKSFSLKATII